MSKGNAELLNWFICDDVRSEVGGKNSFIGVYGDDILVSTIPTLLPQLCIVVYFSFKKPDVPCEIIFRLEFPKTATSTKDLKPITIKQPQPGRARRQGAILKFSPFQFPEVGTYNLYAQIDGKVEKKFGSFEVKLSSNNK